MLRPFDAEGSDDLDDGALGGAVDGLAGDADEAGLAGDEDDASPAVLDHGGCDGLGEEEASLDVGVEVGVEVFGGDFEAGGGAIDAGVVDEDVDAGGFLDGCDGGFDFGEVGDVEGELRDFLPEGAAALAVGARFSEGLSVMTTSAPALARATAIAAPRPVAAPVTRAVLWVRLNMAVPYFFSVHSRKSNERLGKIDLSGRRVKGYRRESE